jgi:hypothetical protein
VQARILVGTIDGLWSLSPDGSVNREILAGRPVIALAGEGTRTWALVEGQGGHSWDFADSGLHARYLRAVAVSGETMLVAVSTGPGGRRAALYRRPLDGDAPFERCRAGLPEWFGDNIDTGCLAGGDGTVVAGTTDGRVFASHDAGATWTLAAKGLPAVRCVHVRQGSHTA